MKLRGFGDVLGYQQSGIKEFKLADPVHHEDLFYLAEKNIKDIELNINKKPQEGYIPKLRDKNWLKNEYLNKKNSK